MSPPPRTALVARTPAHVRLRDSLARLDAAAAARVVDAGDHVEQALTELSARLEGRARQTVREGVRNHAWLLLGAAVGLGLLLGRASRPRRP